RAAPAADRRIVVEQVGGTGVDQRALAAEPGGRIRGAQADVALTLGDEPAVGRIVLLHLADVTPAADELPRIPGRLPHRREGVLPLRTRASAGAAPEAGALLDLGARDRLLVELLQPRAAEVEVERTPVRGLQRVVGHHVHT